MLFVKGGDTITPEYTLLFNAITDAIRALEQLLDALRSAQQKAEEIYIDRDE